MYPIYRWLYRQFAFSRSQSNGFLILLPLCLIFVFSEPVWRVHRSRQKSDFSKESRYLDSLMVLLLSVEEPEEPVRFYFDPNEASVEELERLGFTSGVARRMAAYLEKGGRFRSAEDLSKIYGADSSLIASLVPWVKISVVGAHPRTHNRTVKKGETYQRPEPFDLNQADTSQLSRVRGIGPKLSLRIVRYREALGGFYSPDQLYEVFRLDSAVVRRLQSSSFISSDFNPRQIPINAADQPELAGHPYLTPREAAAIVAYRFTHGKFAAVEDLVKIGGLDSSRLARVAPYLKVD